MTMHKISDDYSEEGVLHFYFNPEGKLVQVPQSQYQALKKTLPPVSFAIKYPISKLEDKKEKLPDIEVLIPLLKPFVEG